MKQIEIAERQVWVHQTTERTEWVIIQPVDEHDLKGLDEEVAWLSNHSTTTFTLVAFRISDWNQELSPWKAPAVFSSEDFGELWCGYQTDVFSSIVGASPSVWFPEWIEFAESHQMKADRVYLSLGDKEPKTKNPVMARVGECIERMHELLDCEKTLEWNEGNHFKDNAIRTAKGLAWAIR